MAPSSHLFYQQCLSTQYLYSQVSIGLVCLSSIYDQAEDITHCNKWLQKQIWQRYKQKARGIPRRRRWVFHDPSDQRKHPKEGVGWRGRVPKGTVEGGGTEGEGDPWAGKHGAVQGKSSRSCDLMVYSQHLSAGRVSHSLLLWKTLDPGRGFRSHSWFTNIFKDLEAPFFFSKWAATQKYSTRKQMKITAQVAGMGPVPSASPPESGY